MLCNLTKSGAINFVISDRHLPIFFFFSVLKGPLGVVSVAGPYRKGKSYILSEAFNQPEVFPLGHEMVAETMGIWLWIVPEKYKVGNSDVTSQASILDVVAHVALPIPEGSYQ